jgi:hypothetical protein
VLRDTSVVVAPFSRRTIVIRMLHGSSWGCSRPCNSRREASVVGATSLSSRSMGSNGFVLNSVSLSSQAAW